MKNLVLNTGYFCIYFKAQQPPTRSEYDRLPAFRHGFIAGLLIADLKRVGRLGIAAGEAFLRRARLQADIVRHLHSSLSMT